MKLTCALFTLEFTTSEPMTRKRSHDFCQTRPLTRRVVFSICKSAWTPDTASKALKECDDDLFPNIYTPLKICATIPATSCECERSASSLRRLHTYNRACMFQERLSSLALMHIHYCFGWGGKSVCLQTPTEAGARNYSEGLVPQYFDVSFYIVKLLLYNLSCIQQM